MYVFIFIFYIFATVTKWAGTFLSPPSSGRVKGWHHSLVIHTTNPPTHYGDQLLLTACRTQLWCPQFYSFRPKRKPLREPRLLIHALLQSKEGKRNSCCPIRAPCRREHFCQLIREAHSQRAMCELYELARARGFTRASKLNERRRTRTHVRTQRSTCLKRLRQSPILNSEPCLFPALAPQAADPRVKAIDATVESYSSRSVDYSVFSCCNFAHNDNLVTWDQSVAGMR